MGKRSRKRGRIEIAPDAPEPARPSRSEARNAEARAGLQPLAEGERPVAVTIAAIVSALLAISNVTLWAAGVEVRGQETSGSGVIVFAVLMLITAAGMWRARYWAVLGFQALLALSIIVAGISLTVASNLAAFALAGGILVLGGTLFWSLVKSMARLQMPERRAPQR